MWNMATTSTFLKLNKKELGLGYNIREMVMTVGPQISK